MLVLCDRILTSPSLYDVIYILLDDEQYANYVIMSSIPCEDFWCWNVVNIMSEAHDGN